MKQAVYSPIGILLLSTASLTPQTSAELTARLTQRCPAVTLSRYTTERLLSALTQAGCLHVSGHADHAHYRLTAHGEHELRRVNPSGIRVLTPTQRRTPGRLRFSKTH